MFMCPILLLDLYVRLAITFRIREDNKSVTVPVHELAEHQMRLCF